MPTRLNPYLNFQNTTRKAMEFYQAALGGELQMNTYGEFDAGAGAGQDQKIMHAQLDAPNGMTLMASDLPEGMEFRAGTNYAISLSGTDERELRGYWDKLKDGATIGLPLEKAPWGDTFGMLTDKFGVNWMINISAA